MKSESVKTDFITYASLPARGVWIEIITTAIDVASARSLPARGVWIEILMTFYITMVFLSHSPRGECGLKLIDVDLVNNTLQSLPARGVWIEILMHTSG